jgi:putative SOS response-associated peptidase YedK
MVDTPGRLRGSLGTRWLGEEPDPRDLMRPYPAELMRMWVISMRVNKPEKDDAAIVEPVELAASV